MKNVIGVQEKFLSDYGNDTLLYRFLGGWKYVYLLLHMILFFCIFSLFFYRLYISFIAILAWIILFVIVNRHFSKIIEREYSIKRTSKIFWNKKAYYRFKDERFAEFIRGEYKKPVEVGKLIQILEKQVNRMKFKNIQLISTTVLGLIMVMASWLLSVAAVNGRSFILVIFVISGLIFVSIMIMKCIEWFTAWASKKETKIEIIDLLDSIHLEMLKDEETTVLRSV
ncbi:hypothetical protein CHISP_3481 [Chitinispirillum alkaliphilum]|nr:hypothetical protein CHISP_3481 [Chitinispirillum alkaliphilum]